MIENRLAKRFATIAARPSSRLTEGYAASPSATPKPTNRYPKIGSIDVKSDKNEREN